MGGLFSIGMALLIVLIIIIFISAAMVHIKEDKMHVLKGLYIYVVSLLSLGVFLIGLATGAYNILGRYFFPKALDSSYMYMLNDCEYNPYAYGNGPSKDMTTASGATLSPQEKTSVTENCKNSRKVQIEEQKAIDFEKSNLLALVLTIVFLPIYILHFFVLRKKL
ncbi:MAG: hypothetical protein ACK4NC_02620 [Candidatus Gracilibacteria bacterium]